MSDTVSQPAPTEAPRRTGVWWYCAGFFAAPVIVLLGVFGIAMTPWFLYHDDYPGMRQSGYSLRLKHVDCEIVIYGDSSSLTGLDPDVISRITGLKTCNISEGTTIQVVMGSDYPLRRYLESNKPPRYLLAMYSWAKFQPTIRPFTEYQPEGVIYGLQYQHDAAFERRLVGLTRWVARFLIWAGHAMIVDTWKSATGTKKYSDPRADRERRHGIWPYPLPAQTQCRRTEKDNAGVVWPDQTGVKAFRRMYESPQTSVVVNVAPVAECEPVSNELLHRLDALHDNPMERLPIEDFNEGDVHFSPAGGYVISVKAGEQIRALMQKSAAGQTAGEGAAR